MTKLIYMMLTSLDGFVEDEQGGIGWTAPDEEVNQPCAAVGTQDNGADALLGFDVQDLLDDFSLTKQDLPIG